MRVKFSDFGRTRHLHAGDAFGFLHGLLRPDAGHDVVGRTARGQDVHRHHRELEAGAALQEQDMVAVGNAGERADVALGTLDDFVEWLRAVADLEDRHADAGHRQEVLACLFEDLDRKHGRPGGKIENAIRCRHSVTTCRSSTSEFFLINSHASSGGAPSRLTRATAASAPSKTMFSVSCTFRSARRS